MKTFIKYICAYLFIFSLIISDLPAQSECGTADMPPGSAPFGNNFIGGYLKPQRTDRDNGNPSQATATFNMLFVFIQFPDEYAPSADWPIGQPPVFMNKFLVENKNGSGQFWNRYKDSSLSDYYQEVSKGAFHVTGITRHMITYHNWDYYKSGVGYYGLLTEIYTRLKADLTINWLSLDRWSRNNTTNNYVNFPDKYLDMMGLFFRHVIGTDFLNSGIGAGEVPLNGPDNFTLFANSTDTVKIDADRTETGSGFIAKGNLGPLYYSRAMGIAIHEYGHYLFGNVHSTSGIMTSNGGLSLNDLFMSGYEKYKLGLLDTLTVNYNTQSTYTVGDVSGRNGPVQLLRVPISDNEFFIVENRRKISQWDVYMLGDTSQTDPFRNTGEYGKGVYIYHNNNIGINYAGNVDVECADGLWNWTYAGQSTPDWSNTQLVNIYQRSSIPAVVNNDGGFFYNLNNSDGVSACSFFSIGKRHTAVGLSGTDKIFTNYPEFWTSREVWGDRFDGWNVGYNEVFSPYSNPNTKTSSNANSGIFIYYNALNSGIANLKIYKTGQGFTEDEILAVTPPSRPMGIVMSEYYVPGTSYCRPRIIWNQNTEPDMLRTGNVKRYKIYKASQPSMSQLPLTYYLLATVNISASSQPEYIDNSVYKYDCSLSDHMPTGTPFPLRYYVKAVDKFDFESVPSDFVQTTGISSGIGTIDADNLTVGPEIPKEFSLGQNFPNPFNPETKIRYDLPEDNFVTVKIYDMLGKEVQTIVNEFKTGGKYIITFNGSNLPSGIYYYKIKAGNFEQVKKMILLK